MRGQMESDLDDILDICADDFRDLRGSHLFLTGGTGFVGSWLLESLVHANRRLGLGLHATALVRDPGTAAARRHLAADEVSLVRGDVRALPSIDAHFDAVIHAATPASAALNEREPLEMIDTILAGGRGVLELARRSGRIPLLFTSSGAVYGAQPADLAAVAESAAAAPDPMEPKNAYHEAKRMAELECAVYAARFGLETKIARLFAFVGPYLPIDRHFAIGNFIADALAGRPIVLTGDGTTVRTYQYASEMTAWLWRILVGGESRRIYHVGSENAVTLATAARAVADAVTPALDVRILGAAPVGAFPSRYVPSTARTRADLGLAETIGLEEGVRRTIRWHREAETG